MKKHRLVMREAIVYRIENTFNSFHRSEGPSVIYFNGQLSFYLNDNYDGAIRRDGSFTYFDPITRYTVIDERGKQRA